MSGKQENHSGVHFQNLRAKQEIKKKIFPMNNF